MTKNEMPASEQIKDVGFLKDLLHQVRLVWYLLRDPDVPTYLKVIPFFAFIYLIIPIDLIPDMVVGLGQLDDLTVLLLGAKAFVHLSPSEIVDYYLAQMKGEKAATYVKPEGPIIIDEEDLE